MIATVAVLAAILGDVSGTSGYRYLRRNDSGLGGLGYRGGEWVEIIQGADFDVSGDGKQWFHLLGRYCLKGSPKLSIAEKMTVKK
jgi:hypothetical protein